MKGGTVEGGRQERRERKGGETGREVEGSHAEFHLNVFIMVARCNRADHIFALWFLLSFFLSSFISSPNLSRRRLDVCHTFTHGVALVRI